MHSQVKSPTLDEHWDSRELLSVTLGQLREWQAEAAPHFVTLPQAAEAPWEGTEIDERRTAL